MKIIIGAVVIVMAFVATTKSAPMLGELKPESDLGTNEIGYPGVNQQIPRPFIDMLRQILMKLFVQIRQNVFNRSVNEDLNKIREVLQLIQKAEEEGKLSELPQEILKQLDEILEALQGHVPQFFLDQIKAEELYLLVGAVPEHHPVRPLPQFIPNTVEEGLKPEHFPAQPLPEFIPRIPQEFLKPSVLPPIPHHPIRPLPQFIPNSPEEALKPEYYPAQPLPEFIPRIQQEFLKPAIPVRPLPEFIPRIVPKEFLKPSVLPAIPEFHPIRPLPEFIPNTPDFIARIIPKEFLKPSVLPAIPEFHPIRPLPQFIPNTP